MSLHEKFDDFLNYPAGLKFETQADDEKIILFLRKHFITNLSWFLTALVLVLLPPIFYSGVLGFSTYDLLELSAQTHVAALLSWYLFVTGFIFLNFMHWFFNIYILTDQRVVDIDFYHLLYKAISAAELEDIQDVTFTMGGIFQAIFNYGNVHLQTAGTTEQFEFHSVPQPAAVQKAILDTSRRKKP